MLALTSSVARHGYASLTSATLQILLHRPLEPAHTGRTDASIAVGRAATNSEFVAFLDADDYWFPEFLHRRLETPLFFCSIIGSIVDDEERVLAGTWSGDNSRDCLGTPLRLSTQTIETY
jgi:hypothetical protein